ALIDYKTGAVGSVGHWVGARPRAPQLPLYALAQLAQLAPEGKTFNAIGAVAYGRVRRGECGFVGISAYDGFDSTKRVASAGEHRALREYDFDDWGDVMMHWHERLSELAKAYLNGDARVDPLAADVCAFCDLHALCRIDAADDDGDDESEAADDAAAT
ncbi:MAG: PD-(D/E)XK nuclease family protein, partial [bacterium]